jgi:hypothetical protein
MPPMRNIDRSDTAESDNDSVSGAAVLAEEYVQCEEPVVSMSRNNLKPFTQLVQSR